MNNLNVLLEDLRRRDPDVRITAQRRLVLDTLFADVAGHYTCEDIVQAAAARGVILDQSTVYRILQWLKNAGLVSQTDLGIGSDVYCLVTKPVHHHMVCLECGAITDLDDAIFNDLRETLLRQHNFQARVEHFAIFGTCATCQANKERQQPV